MLRRLATALLLRRVVRDLSSIALALDKQTAILERLADRVAPIDPPPNRPVVQSDTGVSYLDPIEAGLALDYVAKTQRDTGHTPDEEEILVHLADEKTQDLHQRLIARDQELARLAEERRW